MYFRMNDTEVERFKTFRTLCIDALNKKGQVKSSDYDRFEFIFTPTGIGDAITVRHKVLGIKCSITDYDSW